MQTTDPLSQFSYRRVLLPVAIGIAVSIYLAVVVSRIDASQLLLIPLSRHLLYGLLIALGTVIIRDIAYIYRMWLLADKKLSLWKCTEIIILWEFGSAVTPASVGGITLALFILNKEKVSLGKSTAIILLCSYLDNLAFVVVFATLFFTLGPNMYDLSATCEGAGSMGIFRGIRVLGSYVWIGCIVVAIIGGLLGFGIFVKPEWARYFFNYLARRKWLHRWESKLRHLGEEIWLTSVEYKNKGLRFFLQVFAATTISWCARYSLANALIWTFAIIPLDQIALFARQCVMRMIIMIPSTPGSSGVAELSFMALNCDYLPLGLVSAVAIVWRLYNFYLYLAIGAVVLPRWLTNVNKKERIP